MNKARKLLRRIFFLIIILPGLTITSVSQSLYARAWVKAAAGVAGAGALAYTARLSHKLRSLRSKKALIRYGRLEKARRSPQQSLTLSAQEKYSDRVLDRKIQLTQYALWAALAGGGMLGGYGISYFFPKSNSKNNNTQVNTGSDQSILAPVTLDNPKKQESEVTPQPQPAEKSQVTLPPHPRAIRRARRDALDMKWDDLTMPSTSEDDLREFNNMPGAQKRHAHARRRRKFRKLKRENPEAYKKYKDERAAKKQRKKRNKEKKKSKQG